MLDNTYLPEQNGAGHDSGAPCEPPMNVDDFHDSLNPSGGPGMCQAKGMEWGFH